MDLGHQYYPHEYFGLENHLIIDCLKIISDVTKKIASLYEIEAQGHVRDSESYSKSKSNTRL